MRMLDVTSHDQSVRMSLAATAPAPSPRECGNNDPSSSVLRKLTAESSMYEAQGQPKHTGPNDGSAATAAAAAAAAAWLQQQQQQRLHSKGQGGDSPAGGGPMLVERSTEREDDNNDETRQEGGQKEMPPQQQQQQRAPSEDVHLQRLLASEGLMRCETLNLFRAQLQQLSRRKDGLMPRADGSFPENWLTLAWKYQDLAEQVMSCQRWPGKYPEGLLRCVTHQVLYLKQRLEAFPTMSGTERDQFRRLYVLAALGIIAKLKLVTFCWTFVELKRGEEMAEQQQITDTGRSQQQQSWQMQLPGSNRETFMNNMHGTGGAAATTTTQQGSVSFSTSSSGNEHPAAAAAAAAGTPDTLVGIPVGGESVPGRVRKKIIVSHHQISHDGVHQTSASDNTTSRTSRKKDDRQRLREDHHLQQQQQQQLQEQERCAMVVSSTVMQQAEDGGGPQQREEGGHHKTGDGKQPSDVVVVLQEEKEKEKSGQENRSNSSRSRSSSCSNTKESTTFLPLSLAPGGEAGEVEWDRSGKSEERTVAASEEDMGVSQEVSSTCSLPSSRRTDDVVKDRLAAAAASATSATATRIMSEEKPADVVVAEDNKKAEAKREQPEGSSTESEIQEVEKTEEEAPEKTEYTTRSGRKTHRVKADAS